MIYIQGILEVPLYLDLLTRLENRLLGSMSRSLMSVDDMFMFLSLSFVFSDKMITFEYFSVINYVTLSLN
jgi:hypothetical protein